MVIRSSGRGPATRVAPVASVAGLRRAMIVTPEQAIAFVQRHGIVLESARGSVPSLAEAMAGGPIRGSWWSHPFGRNIFQATRAVRASDQILVCRLIDGKVTFIHRRLWPALVRASGCLPAAQLSQLREEHTSSGRHVTRAVPFPDWVPPATLAAAGALTERAALRMLNAVVPEVASAI